MKKKRKNTAFYLIKLILRCSLSGIYLIPMCLFSATAVLLVVLSAIIALVLMLFDWGSWFLLYLVIQSLFFIPRAGFSKLLFSKIQKELEQAKKLGKEVRTLEEIMGDEEITPNEKLVNMKKRWKNEEALIHLDNVYQSWLQKINTKEEFSTSGAKDLKPLKEWVRKKSSGSHGIQFDINYVFSDEYSEVNEDVKTGLERVSQYKTHVNDQFLEDTIAIIDIIEGTRNGKHLGLTGEKIVEEYLESFKDELNPLYGVRFQSDNGTVENDVLLFTERGVYSLEIKNIMSKGHQKLKVGRDGQTYEWKNGDWKSSSHTKIFDQVNRHTVLTEKKLAEKFDNKRESEVRTIIVIPNENVEIINESHFEIMRPSQILAFLRKEPLRLNRGVANQMKEFMKKQDIGQGEFTFPDIEAYSEALDNRLKIIAYYPEIINTAKEIRLIYSGINGQVEAWRLNSLLTLKREIPIL